MSTVQPSLTRRDPYETSRRHPLVIITEILENCDEDTGARAWHLVYRTRVHPGRLTKYLRALTVTGLLRAVPIKGKRGKENGNFYVRTSKGSMFYEVLRDLAHNMTME